MQTNVRTRSLAPDLRLEVFSLDTFYLVMVQCLGFFRSSP